MTSQPTSANNGDSHAPSASASNTVFAMPPPEQGGGAIAMPAPAPSQPPTYADVMNEKTALRDSAGERKGYNSNGEESRFASFGCLYSKLKLS